MNTKIIELIKNAEKPFFSFEFFPPANAELMRKFNETVTKLETFKPLFVSVTYGAGGGKQDNTLVLTSELARKGYETMAHLTCAGSRPDNILEFLDRLLANGINNVLALRGDPPKDTEWDWEKGYFKHASDLVSFIHRERPQMGIGIAAYPTPHPESSSYENDRKYTALKFSKGADFAITQLFFDPREYASLVADLRKQGYEAPVIPGILTIQSFEGLKRVLSLCGASIPAKLYIELEEANSRGGSEALREAGIRFTLSQIQRLIDEGAPGFHLYTLNKADLCARILQESGLLRNR